MPEVSIPPARGCLAVPDGEGPWPGVVVIHEVFGLNADIRSKADQLDAERVLAGSCPVVASYGDKDPMGAGHPQRLEAALTALDVPHDLKVYPGAGHSFMSRKLAVLASLTVLTRMDFKPEATQDAWQRIFAFFGQHLR